jgi:hydrogenase maturation protease
MNPEFPVTPDAELLVIGYGNTLRHDDGVGPRVAEVIEELNLPGVRTLISQQLSPEHAEPVARARRVIFVDAAVDQSEDVKFRKLVPGETTQLMAHAADPRTMLALARDVFGHAPEAWWLTIRAVKLGFGTDFSPEAEAGLQTAVAAVKKLVSGNFRQDIALALD